MTNDDNALFIAAENLENYAASVARAIKPDGVTTPRAVCADIRRSLREIERAHDAATLKWRSIAAMPGCVRWLLDNHYLVRREGLAACAGFAASASLRCCSGGPVLLVMCAEFTRSGGFEVSPDRLETFLRGFQKSLILSRAELACLEWGLRAVLVRQLAVLCAKMDGDGAARLETDFEHIFTSLRYLASCDLGEIIERADFIEQTLRRDPAGVYPLMDEASREYCRVKISRLAKKNGESEYDAAQRILALAKKGEGVRAHVGYWLLRGGAARRGGLYIAANLLLTLFFSLLAGFATRSAAAFFLLLAPLSELIKNALDFAILHLAPPAQLLRLELAGGVPEEGRTLCAVSCLLTGADDGPALARRLEEYRLCSRDCGENLLFALLADLPDTKSDDLPGSDTWLERAAGAVRELNDKYSGGFFLLARPRAASPDGRWRGWERKRGAILETMRLLRGQECGVKVLAGDAGALKNVRFLLTLDTDTRLTPESARELIGAALHPLNRPEVDEKTGVVRAGHGIISPRVSTELGSATGCDFALVFAGQGGADPYGGACGEVYMDLWASGGFAGKGVIDVDAYLACMGARVPEGLMLSHDAIEGAFLRGGYMSGTELIDGFPSGPLSYYKRLHRWVRGDWQNLPWIFRRGRALPDIERFRLFDSLRRSVVPVLTFAAIVAGFFIAHSGAVIAACAALLCCASQLLITTAETLLRSQRECGVRFHSRVYNGVGGGLVRTVLRLILLPVEAYFCLDAILRALWRMLVSKKNLLQWQTAGQSDTVRAGIFGCYRAMWPAAAAGLWLALCSPAIIGRAAGVIWLLSPLCAYFLGVPGKRERGVNVHDRAYLTACAREIWGFFDDFLCENDNFLPPDNYQAQPPVGLAHRTSPTNIGMALLSVLTALDLELCTRERAMELISRCLDTLERLEKWNGHLYNWYDTQTLEPLRPRYVSTVDSGNLCACLTALETGLAEYGRADLAARSAALAAPMDFAPLYDKRRRLFYIGLDAETGEFSQSWYDLLSSEARLAGYVAIARGDVPRRHWRRLSRAQVQKNSYRGMASWTGTMFEYLMPELLLPLYRESLLYESARFCLYAQKRRTAGTKRPWGVSESAFYSLDASMSYRYKAHGCAALALKPGMDDELVVSPYSSFLALAVEPRAAVANLRRFGEPETRGRYGFWEAVDYTPSRCRPGGDIVRCVMSHHLGMSLAAIGNYLCDNALQRRFMENPEMRAYSILLQEKVPLGGIVLRRERAAKVSERPARDAGGDWVSSGPVEARARPECCQLSNGLCSLLLTEYGHSRLRWGEVSPYIPAGDFLGAERGVDILLRRGGAEISLLPPYGGDGLERAWRFSPEGAALTASCAEFSSEVAALLPRSDAGEVRRVTLGFPSGEGAAGELVLRFSPLLAGFDDFASHPAYWKLGLSVQVRDGCLLVRRLARGKLRECWLALACSLPCAFYGVPGLDTGRFCGREEIGEEPLFLVETLTECAVELPPDVAGVECAFSLAMAHDGGDALEAAKRGLSLASDEVGDLPRRAAAVMGMAREDFEQSRALLPWLCFPTAARAGDVRRAELWKFGVSGDLPVVCADCAGISEFGAARRLMDSHLLLCGSGADFDLVFITHDGASYRKAQGTALNELLWRNGGDALSGARGGVHIVDVSDGVEALRNCACRVIELANITGEPEAGSVPAPAATPEPGMPGRAARPDCRWEEDGRFVFSCAEGLPPRAWANILTNGRFGALCTDCGGGNMWYLNSRENPLSPWLCRPLGTDGPEALYVSGAGEHRVSLFAGGGGENCSVSFMPGAAVWEKEIGAARASVTAFVPPETDARVLIIRAAGLPEGARLHWRLDLAMAPNPREARYTVTAGKEGVLCAKNDRAMAQALPFAALTSPRFDGFTCSGELAACESYGGECGALARPVFALTLPAGAETVIVCGCDRPERLQALCKPGAAGEALERTLAWWRERADLLRVSSPAPELDKLMNGWIFYQAMACRVLGRCSIYQSGGAYGFRDQLQDTVNLIPFDPGAARAQILRSARRQYPEGDVQHWWHTGDGEVKGVRTRCSDDLLWLPWAVCEYVEQTGDRSVLAQTEEYIASAPLKADERDRYECARPSGVVEDILRHCARALDEALRRGRGAHGLLLFGSGDWNDGFDAVGGESQWLTWFFCHTAGRFAELAEREMPRECERWREAVRELAAAANAAWDGEWFLRGYYADGSPLGSAKSRECRIDSIAQSFAAFCPGADEKKLQRALDSAFERLYDAESGLVKLFDPPFSGDGAAPGYIASYGPGFRENGGQYTHGALWLVTALLRAGRAERAWEILRAMLPAGRDALSYKAEPFVLAADVYSAAGHEGEAGWSWYTGSAGWLLRTVMRELLGLKLRGGLLTIEPKLPPDWPGCEVVFRGLRIKIAPDGVTVDGQDYNGGALAVPGFPGQKE